MGLAPAYLMQFAVAMKEKLGHKTSWPAPIPEATIAMCNPVVQEETATAYAASTYSANRRSSSATRGPVVTQPLRRTSATACSSSCPKYGRATGICLVATGVAMLMRSSFGGQHGSSGLPPPELRLLFSRGYPIGNGSP